MNCAVGRKSSDDGAHSAPREIATDIFGGLSIARPLIASGAATAGVSSSQELDLVVRASSESGELKRPRGPGVAVAVEDGVELGVTGVTAITGKKGAGICGVWRNITATEQDVFSSNADGLVIPVTGNIHRGYE